MSEREDIREELQCKVFSLNTLGTYKYTVICSRYAGKWILSRHKNRDTWETQGGHIEPGETPLEAAKRELYEESGIRDADMYPVCDYLGYNRFRSANGMVFLAVVHWGAAGQRNAGNRGVRGTAGESDLSPNFPGALS